MQLNNNMNCNFNGKYSKLARKARLKRLYPCVLTKPLGNLPKTDEKIINKAIFKQTLIFFLLPLSLAIVHTIFGIKFCLIILESIGIDSLAKAIITTGGLIILIYGGYFVITYLCNKNIIKE